MKWGSWVFDPKNLTLSHAGGACEIDLEELHSSAAILDWIFQIVGKEWADAKTMHDLLRAFDDILSPQENYCSSGKDKKADGGKLSKAFAKSNKK